MKTVCIRTDGNDKIATGHIQRCLSIARAVRAVTNSIISQREVFFIVSDEKSKEILEERFDEKDEFPIRVLNSDHEKLKDEADMLFDCISQLNTTSLLIDSYAVDENFFTVLHRHTEKVGIKLVYLDDLQSLEKYDVDVIINYSTVSEPASYMSVPEKLLGKKFTPLRSQFSDSPAPIRERVSGIFISSGGIDPFGVCTALCKNIKDHDFRILTSRLNKNYDELKELESKNDNIHIYEGISDVASVMKMCDMAICAGGTTLGELCALGIPSVSYIIAENQRAGVYEFEKDGIIPCAGDLTEDPAKTMDNILAIVAGISSKPASEREVISKKMRGYIDGTGASKIAEILID
ncbi:MAG: UDP-2,4-diacetamido-2,4,6-trideoxy-beta-L-altropyranose hydrolase [Lachnospiraceae bacterium]|nr:UDP-2,4-diacetamido-2,4,6-trideoxy-beta-L-altropyranose hydrolase [Lachnospiraceae bacterium]